MAPLILERTYEVILSMAPLNWPITRIIEKHLFLIGISVVTESLIRDSKYFQNGDMRRSQIHSSTKQRRCE